MCPKVNDHSHVPTVDEAITSWPNTRPVAPARSRLVSSMQSPTATMPGTRVSSLRPGPMAHHSSVDECLESELVSRRGGQQQARVGLGVLIVKR